MLFFPEVKVAAIITSIFNFLKIDFAENVSGGDESNTYIYKIFHDENGESLKSRNFDYYNQAKAILLLDNNDERSIQVYPIFNRTRVSLPSVHIFSPQESNDNNSIGFTSYDIEKIGINYNINYSILVTSEDILEVQIIHNVLRALLLASIITFEYYGILNPKISNQDIILKGELVPDNIYSKNISFTANYEENFPLLLKPLADFIIKDIIFKGKNKI